MANTAIEKKSEFFQRTNSSSSLASILPEKSSASYGMVSTSTKSTDFGRTGCSAFPVANAPRPIYEWIAPSSKTSIFSSTEEMINSLLTISYSELETSRKTADLAVQSILTGVYALDKNDFNRLAAQEVMLFVEKNLRRNGMTEANRLLELADTSRLSSRSLIGLIRSTARLKDQLPAWRIAYQKSREEVARQGKNPDALFVGLPKL